MLSIRALSRALPRASTRIAQLFTRRTFASLRKPLTQRACAMAWTSRRAPFSTTFSRMDEQEGSVDQELSAKFESERQLEIDASNPEQLPAHLQEYLDSSPWQLHDTPGEEEVTLTRSFGKEKIKLTFTVADLNYDTENEPYPEDPALYDEETDAASSMQQGGAQSKGTINSGRTKGNNIAVAPEDSISPADRPELSSAEDTPPSSSSSSENNNPPEAFPARLHITIEKEGLAGALHVEALVRDGDIMTETLHFFPKKELAEAKSAEADWSRRGLYTGPPFANLDEELQVLVDRYIQERGVDTALAVWVPDYVDWKEQREYVAWLAETKNFIDA